MEESDPLPVDTGSGITVTYLGRHLYPSRGPVRSAEDRAKAAVLRPQTLVFLPSPLLFYGVTQLLEMLPPSCHLLCIETDQKLMALSSSRTEAALLDDPRITYARTESVSVVVSIAESLDLSRFRRCLLVSLTGGYALNRRLYDEMMVAVEDRIGRYWQNRMTEMRMGRLWMRNLFRNLPAVEHHAGDLAACTDGPIVVLGAGESLEALIPKLPAIRKRCHLMAVDTALPSLHDAGVTPDLVVVVEGQPLNYMDFLSDPQSGARVVCDLTSFPGLLRQILGPKHYFVSRFADCGIFSRMGAAGLLPDMIPPLGSVGVVAVYLALRMTRGPVFISGIDFCYPAGKPHARGAPSHRLSLKNQSRVSPVGFYSSSLTRPRLRVEGKDGAICETDLVMQGYRDTLYRMIEREPRVHDLAPTGLRITPRPPLCLSELRQLLPQGVGELVPSGKSPPRLTQALDFLRDEEELLRQFLVCARAGESEQIDGLLGPLDYVTLDFPTSPGGSDSESTFLSRCIASASHYLSEVGRARAVGSTSYPT